MPPYELGFDTTCTRNVLKPNPVLKTTPFAVQYKYTVHTTLNRCIERERALRPSNGILVLFGIEEATPYSPSTHVWRLGTRTK
jgi:hypothetical protein